ncbi:MAG TPA: MarR family winged helix-turn-helix transcriptional regulator [Streptosporangiaceae bacterium]|jgi:DNA-binding MarR family transcriptional regulator
MGTSTRARPVPAPDIAAAVRELQAATRVLAGIALRSLDALDGAVTLAQFRMLSVLADLGQARSARVAAALGLEASTVTRLADRLEASGHVRRGREAGHRSVVTLELTGAGQQLVTQVESWRQQELGQIVSQLLPADRFRLTTALSQLVTAAGAGYGTVSASPVPV